MKRQLLFLLSISFVVFSACSPAKKISQYESDNLRIEKVGKHSYVHTSFLETQAYGKVPCNGMIFVDKGEAIVFDTPTTDEVSSELIRWVEEVLKAKIKAVVPTHFHVDCLGGLQAFHDAGISSYSYKLTLQLAKEGDVVVPQNAIEGNLRLALGNTFVECAFLGEGHTYDNIVAYFPKDQALFGGCLVKSDGAGKGNLADANVGAWPTSVEKVKNTYSNAKIVVPGHGKYGGTQLLDYTVQLFRK